ncbi:MAG TPA: zinc-binding alcohol dehydrogenase family protein [Streptosporangiaceae bacterium]|nr:zinc-binding alcohol dehydrogenase family protein [Streptosporangiaceae bacterium]
MKAAILSGPDSVPVYGDFDEPMAGDGSEIVELVAAGIHHLTRSVASGRHYGSGGVFPVIPGLNAVARTASGGLVFTSSGPPPFGTLAERIVSPEEMRFPLPDQAPPEAVAAGVNPGLASWLPLTARRAQAGKLGTVLVLGVTGMAGFLAAQNARLLGAGRVVGAGRSQPGLARAAAAGARTVSLDGDRDHDTTALAAALGDDAPGLVLDFVWGPVAEAAFRALGRTGLSEDRADISYVQIGALAGPEAAVPSSLLRSRKLTISGSGAGSVPAAAIKAEIPRYIKLIADGSVQVPYRTFPLSEAGAAWTASAQAGPRVVVVRD